MQASSATERVEMPRPLSAAPDADPVAGQQDVGHDRQVVGGVRRQHCGRAGDDTPTPKCLWPN
ncbi:MAG: hypothetical protein ACR2K2_17005 [Mycobacteriales bacterium]